MKRNDDPRNTPFRPAIPVWLRRLLKRNMSKRACLHIELLTGPKKSFQRGSDNCNSHSAIHNSQFTTPNPQLPIRNSQLPTRNSQSSPLSFWLLWLIWFLWPFSAPTVLYSQITK